MARRVTPLPSRVAGAALLAVAAGVVLGLVSGAALGALAGLVVLPLTFVLWSLAVLVRMDAEHTHRAALSREEDARRLEEVLVVLVAVGCLVVIALLQALAKSGSSGPAALLAFVGVFSAWAMLHTMYATRYAHLYYAAHRHRAAERGVGHPAIDFNDTQPPRFVDFYYFSFNLGMTFQVSDTSVSSSALRAVVLRHCLLSYLFSTVILAATINLVVAIVTGG